MPWQWCGAGTQLAFAVVMVGRWFTNFRYVANHVGLLSTGPGAPLATFSSRGSGSDGSLNVGFESVPDGCCGVRSVNMLSPCVLVPPLGLLISSIALSNREYMTTGDAAFEVAALWYYPGVFFWFVIQPVALFVLITNARGDPKVRPARRSSSISNTFRTSPFDSPAAVLTAIRMMW